MKTLILAVSIFPWVLPMAVTLKVGVLAPEGTSWANKLKDMAKEVEETTGGRAKFRFYFGGVQGDEPDVLRKIRIGQLHGGIFSGKTLGEIHGDVRVLELPFTFYHDREKAQKAMTSLSPFLNSKLEERGFVSLGLTEIGQVYFVSRTEAQGLQGLTGQKIWSWEGDTLVNTILEEMSLISVPLGLPDVLSSLSTGIIDGAYAPPLGILALQWHTKISHLIDFPLAYSVAAFLIDKRAWATLENKDRESILKVGQKFARTITNSNARDNTEALEAMKAMGVNFIAFPDSDIEKGRTLREKVVEKLKGNYFSQEAYNKLTEAL